ncbi:unnamed protein product [Durusdinium trenchii]|uniref:Uncharacterized protein n=1 Tax=Durusdinium trenchii TaxID=1381693 RepID=A0ABP0R4D7_9DINO
MQYEGLPFVGHRRLRNFLAHWYEQGSPLNLLDASPEAPSLDEDAGMTRRLTGRRSPSAVHGAGEDRG